MQHRVPNRYDDPESLIHIWEQMKLGRGVSAIETGHAAERDSHASLDWVSREYAWAEVGDRLVPILTYYGPESAVGVGIVNNKALAKELMAAAGVSVPAGRRVASAKDAVQAQKEIGTSVVIKPQNGSMGHGVTVNISDAQSIREAYDRARVYGHAVLVEQYVDGEEYRAHATPTECVGLFKRLLPSVTGDGQSTIEELVREKNELRKLNPSTRRSPIPLDDVTEGYLARHGLALDFVLPEGETIVVRDVNGITSGGESEQCLESAPQVLKDTAVGAAAAIPGMHWAGVDILLEKNTGTPYVIEANTNAAFHGSSFPVYGQRRDVGAAIWQALLKHARPRLSNPTEGLHLNEEPRSVRGSVPGVVESDAMRLKNLFQNYVRDLGMHVTPYGPEMWTAENEDSPRLWFRGLRTVADMNQSVHPLRWHALLRQVLRRAGIPVPAGRLIRGAQQFLEFHSSHHASVEVLPVRNFENVRLISTFAPGSAPMANPILHSVVNSESQWFVQEYKQGHRYRVIASETGALAVMASSSQELPSREQIDEVVRLAVGSVRALPQLRWAAVDVVMSTGHDASEGFVEGMTFRPMLVSNDLVVAGSLRDVFEMLLASAGSEDSGES